MSCHNNMQNDCNKTARIVHNKNCFCELRIPSVNAVVWLGRWFARRPLFSSCG